MATHDTPVPTKRYIGRIIVLVLFLLLLFVIVPRIDSFSASFSALGEAQIGYVAIALLLTITTFWFAGGVYQALALKLRGVSYKHTVLVQVAGAFTNRLLPAGLGALSLNVQYLRKHGHTVPQAAAVSGLNNIFGFIGHLLLLALALLVGHETVVGDMNINTDGSTTAIGVLLLLALAALVTASLSSKFRNFVASAWLYLGLYRKHPEKLVGALACSIALTLCYVCIFYASALALDIHLNLLQIFMVFTIGMIGGTISPTPGGLVGAEAGLVAGLVAYGVDASPALAVALLYRFMTYWLPLIPGFITLLYIRKRYL